MYNLTKQNPIIASLSATVAMSVIAAMTYLLFEPTAMFAASETNNFTITQEIGSEISFATSATDFTMDGGAIGGATGGTRTGSTTVGITTNNAAGYTLTINFATTTGMVKDSTGADFIEYYSSTTPDFNMNIGASNSGFAYSASSSASTNSITTFDNDGSTCGAGANVSADNCYVMHGTQTSGASLVVTADTAVNELTKVGFKVIVAGGSGIANGLYYATTTLTATTN